MKLIRSPDDLIGKFIDDFFCRVGTSILRFAFGGTLTARVMDRNFGSSYFLQYHPLVEGPFLILRRFRIDKVISVRGFH
jgi:hypothetical protein